jgi:hypothetical protein
MNLPELLRMWAKLEPERCEHWTGIPVETFTAPLGTGHQVLLAADEGSPSSPLRLAIIQAAVQEAIEARGWKWLISHAQAGHYEAQAGPRSLEPAYSASTPGEALLSAYLAALEAQS